MKKLFLLLALAACSPKPVTHAPVPSTGGGTVIADPVVQPHPVLQQRTTTRPRKVPAPTTLAAMAARVDSLFGDYTKPVACAELDANRPAYILGDGGYPERFRLKQIGCAIDAAVTLVGALNARVSALEAKVDLLTKVGAIPTVIVPVDVPVGPYGQIRAMTAAEATALIPAMNAGIGQGISPAMVAQAQTGIGGALYPVQDASVIDGIKVFYYGAGNKNALRPYLSAIDQRDLQTNALLAFNDPRVVHMSGLYNGQTPAPAPAPAPAPTNTPPATNAGDLVVTGNLIVMGQASFGGPLKDGVGSQIQMHGRGGAEIISFSNESGLDAQNPGNVHCGVISVPGNDGGTRIIQGGYWGSNGFVDCDATRGLNIWAFDSLGGFSLYKDDQDGTHERAQDIVFRDYPDQKRWTMTSMRTGWKMCIGWSNVLNNFENTYCPPGANAAKRGAAKLALPPLTMGQLMGHTEKK